MTLYLTDNTAPEEIHRAKASGIVHAVKYYPAGATTNSDSGVTSLDRVARVLAAMESAGRRALRARRGDRLRGRRVRSRTRVRRHRAGAESCAISRDCKVVLEHITTREAVAFVQESGSRIAATITPQHLLWSRNALFAGGLRPHLYCLPILKRETHRHALVAAATSGQSAGSFSAPTRAPHARHTKENACGCAGCYSAPCGAGALCGGFRGRRTRWTGSKDSRSRFGADFYGLPRNTATVTLVREPWTVPAEYAFGDDTLVPLRAGEAMRWRVLEVHGSGVGSAARRHRSSDAVVRTGVARRIRGPKPARPSLPSVRGGERKVRAPQSRMPGNARPQ